MFLAVHTLAHPGIRDSKRLMSSRFVWKGMAADVGRWYKECQACQMAKLTTQPSSATYSSPQPALYSYSCGPGGPSDGQC